MALSNETTIDNGFDVFISHAFEDKDYVSPLAHGLREVGLTVWYDEFELKIGDSINEKINAGLSQCRFGIVVFSPSFFSKHWTQHEMNGLMARQMSGDRVILPVWHRITKDEIVNQAPSMADFFSLNTSTHDMATIVEKVCEKVNGSVPKFDAPPQSFQAPSQSIGPNFGVFYVAQEHTRELPFPDQPDGSTFLASLPPTGWVSIVHGDEELEYLRDGSSLRIRLDYGNQWRGDEIVAQRFLTNSEPFALIIRPSGSSQIYLPSVVISPSSARRFGDQNRSGWVNLWVQQ